MLLLIIFRGRLRALELSYVQSNICYMNVNKLIKYDVDNVFNVSFLFIFLEVRRQINLQPHQEKHSVGIGVRALASSFPIIPGARPVLCPFYVSYADMLIKL